MQRSRQNAMEIYESADLAQVKVNEEPLCFEDVTASEKSVLTAQNQTKGK